MKPGCGGVETCNKSYSLMHLMGQTADRRQCGKAAGGPEYSASGQQAIWMTMLIVSPHEYINRE